MIKPTKRFVVKTWEDGRFVAESDCPFMARSLGNMYIRGLHNCIVLDVWDTEEMRIIFTCKKKFGFLEPTEYGTILLSAFEAN